MPKKTIENCSLIKRMVNAGVGYPDYVGDNKCQGYVISESNDEPCEQCKICKWFDGECDDE